MKKTMAALAALMLAACSSGPSKGAMEEAFLTWMHENADKSVEIREFKNGDCEKSDTQPGYACSLQAKVTARRGAYNDTVRGTFIFDQIDGEWKVVGRTM